MNDIQAAPAMAPAAVPFPASPKPLRPTNETQAAPAYRSDIDGLRALAVAAVILYHAEVPGFGGGYIGVDVFFVISGYLITRLLTASGFGVRDVVDDRRGLAPELSRDAAGAPRLRLREFYMRRGRRILPALFVTSLVIALPAVAILLPWDLARLGEYLAATSVFVSNIPPWIDGHGYFDARLAPVAVTHFWSIAVEEQFYLFYPLTLYLIGRYLPRHRSATLGALAAASLALCVFASYHRPIANFFLAPPRAWELLLGALLVTTEAHWIRQRLANEVLAALALLTLVLVACSYAPATQYPGLRTIAPCAAAALLLVTAWQHPTAASRFLSLRPLVFTGLISYSLYLWHLPLLVLARYYNIQPLGPAGLAALIAAIYLLAALSWKLIEKPVRLRQVLKSDRSFVLSAIAASAITLVAGLVLWLSNGLPLRFPADVRTPDQNWMASSGSVLKCVNRPAESIAAGDICSYGPQVETAPRALVWGDSHAMAALPAYEQLAATAHVRIYIAVKPACRPLLGVTNRADSEARQNGCATFNAAVVRAIGLLRPRVVILNAHWIDADADLVPHSSAGVEPGASHFRQGLEETLKEIHAPNREVCAVLDIPVFKYNVPYAVAMARRRGISADFLQISRADALSQYRAPELDFRLLQQRGALTTVDLKDRLCRADSCAYQSDGNLLYADRDHLSVRGALFVSSALEGCFRARTTDSNTPSLGYGGS